MNRLAIMSSVLGAMLLGCLLVNGGAYAESPPSTNSPAKAPTWVRDYQGHLHLESDFLLAEGKCTKFAQEVDPAFDTYATPYLYAYGSTQAAFEFMKCMTLAGIEVHLLGHGDGCWHEDVRPTPANGWPEQPPSPPAQP
jgi:hypothetical protein